MVKPPLFDSNILLDYLNGDEQAKHEFDRINVLAISQITWMEVMVGSDTGR
jgi:predicted nucleic acid-binding protein